MCNTGLRTTVRVRYTVYVHLKIIKVCFLALGFMLPIGASAADTVNTWNTNGSVNAIAQDGSGGWYIGGQFTVVEGVARNNAAHILASGAVDTAWNPNPNNTARALAVSGGGGGGGGGSINAQTVPSTTSSSGLSNSQILSILNLLTTFGVD